MKTTPERTVEEIVEEFRNLYVEIEEVMERSVLDKYEDWLLKALKEAKERGVFSARENLAETVRGYRIRVTPERSVEEIKAEFQMFVSEDDGSSMDWLENLLQAERQKRDEMESDLRNDIASMEQSWMFLKDEYSELARAIGVKGDAWFGDPLVSHREVLKTAQALTHPNNSK